MKERLLVICGQTATGKTLQAISIAKKYSGEIISADSRQVYKEMNIGTGKELSEDFGFRISDLEFGVGKLGYYTNHSVSIWGYDLANPKEDFNVSRYFDTAKMIIADIWNRKKLPIITGGTGLYIKALLDGMETADIVPNSKVRDECKGKSPEELYNILYELDKKKAEAMNDSDRKNPRRLVRKIEIAKNVSGENKNNKNEECVEGDSNRRLNYDSLLMVGLTAKKDFINKEIEKRVLQRLDMGFENEVKTFLKGGIDWKYGSMLSTGYRQYEDFYKGKINKDEFIKRWIFAEQKYAKRQMTWFKKDKRINWFDVSKCGFSKEVEKLVESWYHEV